MIYGFAGKDEDGQYVVVCAHNTLAEFEALVPVIEANGFEVKVAEGIDFLMDAKLSGMMKAIIVALPDDLTVQSPFGIGGPTTDPIYVELVHKNRALQHQREMMAKEEDDIFHHETGDKRPISEVFGLDKDDPWDLRSEEKKAKDAEQSVKGKDASKAGDLTGDGSFAPAKTDKTARVTDVRVSLNPDGSVSAADVLAVKGLHDKDEEPDPNAPTEEEKKALGIILTCEGDFTASGFGLLLDALGIEETSIEYGPGWLITPLSNVASQLVYSLGKKGYDVKASLIGDTKATSIADTLGVGRPPFAMFFRVDVRNCELINVVEALRAEEVNLSTLLGRGENDDAAWIGVSVERLASNYADMIRKHYPLAETEVYAVNLEGERMAPEGVEVLDPNAVAEYGPRPWSDPVGWKLMSDDEREAETKKVKAEEFIFSGSYHMGRGSVVLFTPKSYFEEHNEPWDGDVAPFVERFFPQSLALVTNENGTFSSRSVQYDTVVFKLARQGFVESTRYRLWLNMNF